MRYAPEHDEATREGILEAPSRLVWEHGIAQSQAFDALAGWLSMRRGMKVGRSDAAAFQGLGTLQLARVTPDSAESDVNPGGWWPRRTAAHDVVTCLGLGASRAV